MSIATKVVIGFVALGIAGGAVFAWKMSGSGGPSNLTATSAAAPDRQLASSSTGLAQSADKVRTHVLWTGEADSPALEVHLEIAQGWHVNANPASLKFLIPTEVSVTSAGTQLPFASVYPRGEDSGIRLEGTAILVYSDGAVIRVTPQQETRVLPSEDGAMEIATRIQACSDEGICLAPSTLHDAVSLSSQ